MWLGKTIKALRDQAGWSQKELAYYAKVSRSWLSRLETGSYVDPSPAGLMRVAQALGADVNEWFRAIDYRLPAELKQKEGEFSPEVIALALQIQSLGPDIRGRAIRGIKAVLEMADKRGRRYPEAQDQRRVAEEREEYKP